MQDKVSGKDECLNCHKEMEILPVGYQEYDIHLQSGLSCASCHGGDSNSDDEEIAMSKEKGFIGIPTRNEIPDFCGKCHSNGNYMKKYHPGIATDQVSQYYTSVHGKKFKEGDNKVATCVNCHKVHQILPAKDPRSSVYPLNLPQTCRHCHSNSIYMKNYKIPTNQYELYASSVHGIQLLDNKDIGAPTCNDCHGNHGASPPGLTSVVFICGSCHVKNMEYFRETRMSKAFDDLRFHGCEQCHGYHNIEKTTDNFVGTNKEAFCVKCHEPGEKGYETAGKIRNSLSKLDEMYKAANEKLQEVQLKGMNDVDIGFQLKDAHQKLIEARTLVHTFNSDTIAVTTNEGTELVKQSINMADTEIKSYYNRRNGFLITTFVLVILAVGLYLKIKDIEKVKKEKVNS
jgi:predicted CXXCH cytochrome family protein